jgi:hypothetical protein
MPDATEDEDKPFAYKAPVVAVAPMMDWTDVSRCALWRKAFRDDSGIRLHSVAPEPSGEGYARLPEPLPNSLLNSLFRLR